METKENHKNRNKRTKEMKGKYVGEQKIQISKL